MVVVSNQAGVARGYFTESAIAPIHDRLKQLLAKEGASLDDIFYCPHHPDGSVGEYSYPCECRKPKPGMLLQAAQKLNLTLTGSWLIGDNISDIQAGLGAGCNTILVQTGHGKQFSSRIPNATSLKHNLADAVDFLLVEGRFSQLRCA